MILIPNFFRETCQVSFLTMVPLLAVIHYFTLGVRNTFVLELVGRFYVSPFNSHKVCELIFYLTSLRLLAISLYVVLQHIAYFGVRVTSGTNSFTPTLSFFIAIRRHYLFLVATISM